MGIIDNLNASFEYTKEALVGQWFRWILLLIINFIPIVDLIVVGYYRKVLGGVKPAPELENPVQLFIDGLLYVIAAFIWMIPVIIISLLVGGGSMFTAATIATYDPLAGFAAIGLSLIITLIFTFLVALFAFIGLIRFAHMGKFGEAFALGAILKKIGEIGWINYILSALVLWVVIGVIYFVLVLIPVLGWLLAVILVPFFAIFSTRFYCNLYESTGTA